MTMGYDSTTELVKTPGDIKAIAKVTIHEPGNPRTVLIETVSVETADEYMREQQISITYLFKRARDEYFGQYYENIGWAGPLTLRGMFWWYDLRIVPLTVAHFILYGTL